MLGNNLDIAFTPALAVGNDIDTRTLLHRYRRWNCGIEKSFRSFGVD
jgi:hypothetical protein